MDKVIVIVGPTGVGKSKLGVELAKKLNGEIISGDSVQVYKRMDIGSAKVSDEEKKNIEHYLIDIKNIEENYSVYEFQKEVREKIELIKSKGKLPILVGGTGLYLKAALYDYEFKSEESMEFNEYEELTNKEVHNLLKELDPIEANKLHENNRVRVVRALNIIKNNNMSKTQMLENQKHEPIYDAMFIGLTSERSVVYERINSRVDKMIENGLLEEVESIYKDYNDREYSSLKAIGYKELIEYFKGNMSLEDSIELIKKRSRNYAKRQYTWFKNQFNTKWFEVDFDDFSNTVNLVVDFIKSN